MTICNEGITGGSELDLGLEPDLGFPLLPDAGILVSAGSPGVPHSRTVHARVPCVGVGGCRSSTHSQRFVGVLPVHSQRGSLGLLWHRSRMHQRDPRPFLPPSTAPSQGRTSWPRLPGSRQPKAGRHWHHGGSQLPAPQLVSIFISLSLKPACSQALFSPLGNFLSSQRCTGEACGADSSQAVLGASAPHRKPFSIPEKTAQSSHGGQPTSDNYFSIHLGS